MKIIDKNLISPFLSFMNHEVIAAKDYCYYETIEYEGTNQYKYLNILDHDGPEMLPGNFKNLLIDLHKVIQKRGHIMTEKGMAIVNLGAYPGISLANLFEHCKPKYITIWGEAGEKLGLQLQPFQGKVYKSARVLRMPSPTELISDAALQGKAQNYLKYMFNIQ